MMKISMTSLFLFLAAFPVLAQLDDDFKLPETWTKDFKVSVSHKGSMHGGFTTLRFTFDSCKYTSGFGQKAPKTTDYKMTEKDRAAILEKLLELKADEIHSQSGVHVVNDGWSQSICFGFHCIEGGTSAEMKEKDKAVFLTAYRFLEDFAVTKTR